MWLNVYVVIQFLVALHMTVLDVVRLNEGVAQTKILIITFFVFWSLTTIGQLFDGHPFAWKSEFLRYFWYIFVRDNI